MRATHRQELRGRARGIGAALVLALLLLPPPAAATYSIAAVDLHSGQAGGAGTSCVGSQLSVYEIFGAAPGFGVVMAQAAINTEARDRALQLLAQGEDAPAVLAQITASDFDFASSVRQYAVIDARGAAVGFTGDGTMAYADDVQGRAGDVVYSVQGNILTGAAVLEQAAAVFAAPGCDLADTLMRALEAGADNGQGDSRCTPDGIPSDGAFVRVDFGDGDPDDPLLELQVDDTAPRNPLAELRTLYDAWRADHPCPEPDAGTPDAGLAVPDAGTPVPDASTGTPGGSTAPPTAGGSGAAAAGAGAGAAGAAPAAGSAATSAGTGTGAAAGGPAAMAAAGASGGDADGGGGCAIAARSAGDANDGVGCMLAYAALAATVLVRVRTRRRVSALPRA